MRVRKLHNAWMLCLLVSVGAVAQHRVSPSPGLTSEVQRIRSTRTPFRVSADATLPTAVDNSTSPYFPPIIDQQGGSCAQAAGIGYMFTYEMNRLLQRDARASAENRMSYQFVWNMVNDGQDKGDVVETGLQLARQFGVMSEADYGTASVFYFRWATGYERYVRAMHNRASEILSFSDSIPLIKRYLYDAGDGSRPGGVVTFGTQATGWRFINYDGPSETGYRCLLTQLGYDGAHAMTIAGYDDLVTYIDDSGIRHTGAFIVVNSWGTYSHDNGHFYLPYDFFRDPDVKSRELGNSLNGVRVTTFQPQLIYRIGLSYTSRDDLRLGMSASNNRDASAYSTAYYYSHIFRHQGGDHNMQGRWQPADIDLAIDFTPYVTTFPSPELYFLNVVKQFHGEKTGEGMVTNFQVIDLRHSEPLVHTYHGKLPQAIQGGNNVLALALRPLYSFVASALRWLTDDGIPTTDTLLLRTASGRHAKFRVTGKEGENIRLHYSILNE